MVALAYPHEIELGQESLEVLELLKAFEGLALGLLLGRIELIDFNFTRVFPPVFPIRHQILRSLPVLQGLVFLLALSFGQNQVVALPAGDFGDTGKRTFLLAINFFLLRRFLTGLDIPLGPGTPPDDEVAFVRMAGGQHVVFASLNDIVGVWQIVLPGVSDVRRFPYFLEPALLNPVLYLVEVMEVTFVLNYGTQDVLFLHVVAD